MMRRARVHSAIASCVTLLGLLLVNADVQAQSLGTFRWQLQPFCNVVTLAVTQNGGVFRLEGTDDQCGAGADLVSVIGTAFQNPDGTIGFGLNIVATPGGAGAGGGSDHRADARRYLAGQRREHGGVRTDAR